MTDRYAVIGHPIAQSLSPLIHAAFARATGQDLVYEAVLAPLDGFVACVRGLVSAGLRGANVTVPFKLEAFDLATRRSARACHAGAANTLLVEGDSLFADNTDGAGLVRDLRINLGVPLAGQRIALLGAGGAARGVLGPLLQERPELLVVANRTTDRADALCASFAPDAGSARLLASAFPALDRFRFDLLVNATSSSLDAATLPLPTACVAPGATAYDMVYNKGLTPFLAQCRAAGADALHDGLGMLVEQAAESFALWRGVRPESASVLSTLRATFPNPA